MMRATSESAARQPRDAEARTPVKCQNACFGGGKGTDCRHAVRLRTGSGDVGKTQ